jgi:hypothetical protein
MQANRRIVLYLTVLHSVYNLLDNSSYFLYPIRTLGMEYMGLKQLVTNGLVLRKLLQTSERQAEALEKIAGLLERMANQVAPAIPEPSPDDLKRTEVSFTRDAEQIVIQSFVEKFERTIGRAPTDDEILEHLVERV